MTRSFAVLLAWGFAVLLAWGASACLRPAEAATAPVASASASAPAPAASAAPSAAPRPVASSAPSLPPGLKLDDVVVGTGAVAVPGDRVSVQYTGTLDDGSIFDTSRKRNEPFVFNLGRGQVIKGWDLGVTGMKVGGKRKLTIPADLAYGERGQPPAIPGGATLHFDVELVAVDHPSSANPEMISARHILIAYMGARDADPSIVRTREQARAVAEEVRKQAKAGEDFERLVSEFSDEPGAASRGGALGRFGKGRFVREFDAAAFALKPGEISGVVETPFGFHVIQRTE